MSLAVLFAALGRFPVAQAWVFLAASAAEVAAVAWAVRRNDLRGHPVWTLIALSLVPYFPANVIWYGQPILLHRPLPFPSVADALYIPAYAIQLAGLIVLVRRSGRPDKGEGLDAAIIALAAGLAFWVFALGPSIRQGGSGRLVTLSYPLFDVGLAAIAGRMLAGARGRVPAFWLIAGSIGVQLVADLGYSTTTLSGTFRYGDWISVGYLVQYALLGAAALHPTARDVTNAERPTGRMPRNAQLAMLGAASMLAPFVFLVPGIREDPDDYAVAVIGLVVLLGLGFRRLSGLIVDVDTYHAAQERLRSAELRYRTLVEHMPGVVYIAEFGEGGAWTYVSPKIEDLLGYTPGEWFAHPAPWRTHVHLDDLQRALEDERAAGEEGEPLSSIYRMFTRDGRVLWIRDEAALVPDEDGLPRYWQGVMMDISPLKQTEQQLRSAAEERRRLLARLVSVQEEERRRVANDIHDDPIQKMTAVGMRLAALRARVPEELRESVEQLDRSVSLAIGRLRRLMFELRPAALDREGLESALRQYLRETAEEADFGFTVVNELVGDVSPDVRASAYRIVQEALSNVRKHARASHVTVRLESRDEGVLVRITDDGEGFLVDPQRASPAGHMGLTAMRERAELAGGRFRVESVPGRGTTVEFWLPDRIPATAGRVARASTG